MALTMLANDLGREHYGDEWVSVLNTSMLAIDVAGLKAELNQDDDDQDTDGRG